MCAGVWNTSIRFLALCMMEWDKFAMAQRFLRKANAIHPDDSEDADAREEALAVQDVNYDCYMSSFSREQLLKRLGEIISGQIELPEETKVDEDKYRAAYIKEAKVILSAIEQDNVR